MTHKESTTQRQTPSAGHSRDHQRVTKRAFASLVTMAIVIVMLSMILQPGLASERGSQARVLANPGPLQANAGPDQTVVQGTEVILDGSLSTGNITQYNWTFVYGGQPYDLNGTTPKFRFAEAGVFNITLNVTDGKGNYSTDLTVITATKKPVDILGTYWQEMAIAGVIVVIIVVFYAAISGRIRFVPEATQEKMKLALKRWRKITSQVLHNGMGLTGVIILVFFIAMAAFGPALAPEKIDPAKDGNNNQFERPSPQHWLGTDVYRYDIFSELLYGARTSIIVGVFSAFIASVLGALVGLYSGYAGGWKDEVIMRANDVVLSIPWLVLMIVVAALLQKIDLTGIILIIGLTGWSTTARMVRASVLSIKERQFIERARSIGASDLAIIRRHVMPNAFPLVFANTILTVAISILSEATLSFLGLRPVNTVTWGTMLSRASEEDAFHIGLQGWIVVPGLCIVIVVLGFTLLGYALDDIMNPKLRHR